MFPMLIRSVREDYYPGTCILNNINSTCTMSLGPIRKLAKKKWRGAAGTIRVGEPREEI
eukprot:SAG11_NODE_8109_length_1059_cov_1.410417_1_plen_59_part_00